MSNAQRDANPQPNEHETIHEVRLAETIDGFHVAERLHESALSTLYRVTHADHDLPIVMKVPKISVILPPGSYAGFETEVRILSRLRGAYTPRVVATGDMARCPYLVMEYIEGDALQKAMAQAPVAAQRLCELMVPVCKAVHDLHRHNIIHLDLKPENIRNRRDGRVVLLDFGSAHHTQLPDMFDAARERAPGSLAYIAPEQLHDVRNDSRSDLYALGAIMYQLATGRLPFGQPNPITVKKRLYVPPLPPRATNEGVPPWLQEIILKSLEVHPDDRYPSAQKIAYALSHPRIVPLTVRSEQRRRAGVAKLARMWWRSLQEDFSGRVDMEPRERIVKSPHVLIALDPERASTELKDAMRDAVHRLALADRQSFFTFLCVIEEQEPTGTEAPAALGDLAHPPHVRRQAELRNWIRPLRLPKSHVHFQVFNGDPAEEIVGYARGHVVDHIVIGAGRGSALSRLLGGISQKVAAEAPCSVTVVRFRRRT